LFGFQPIDRFPLAGADARREYNLTNGSVRLAALVIIREDNGREQSEDRQRHPVNSCRILRVFVSATLAFV
jgi:hypothetical protein